jgi:hypothetical protein
MIALHFAGALSRCSSVESPGITYPNQMRRRRRLALLWTSVLNYTVCVVRGDGKKKQEKRKKKERKLNFEKTKKKSDAALLSCRSAAPPPQDFLM